MSESREYSTSGFFALYLAATVLICGAVVMVIEVLGSRIIGPLFGVSLFVWTSLITVALLALAAGYAVGGVIADRRSSPDYMYGIILLAGILILTIPFTKVFVLKSMQPLGLRLGAFLSSLLLFGPSLFLLGCVSPYIVRIAAREMSTIGRTVGILYAVSTAGSFLGTVAAGFFLIAHLGVNRIIQLSGLLLISTAIIYFVLFRKRRHLLIVLIAPLFMFSVPAQSSKIMPDGTRVESVFEKDSFYGKLKVLDSVNGNNRFRELMIDGLTQSGIDMVNKMSIYKYPYFLEFIPYSLNPDGKRCLIIGMGGGVIPVWYEERGIKTDVVDIDPEIISIAKNFFGFRNSGLAAAADARYFLNSSNEKYDYMILDVFNGDSTPGHVLSLEAFRLMNERLTGNGILAINLFGSLKENPVMTMSVVRTLKEVFKSVDVYPLFEKDEGYGNIIITAYNFPHAGPDLRRVSGLPVHPKVKEIVKRYLGRKASLPEDVPSIILSDDYNPVDFYEIRLKEKIRRDILYSADWDFLI
jgi:spermidine synthase